MGLAALFVGIALILLVLPATYSDAIASGIRGTLLRPVIALERGAADRQGRFMDARLVRAERDSLAAFLVDQAGLAAENRELRALLGMRPKLPYSFTPAEVFRLPGPVTEGLFLLSVGSADGVRPGSPIVTAQGLVGTVRDVDEHSSVGIDWTHPLFRVSAVALDGETYGMLEPRTNLGSNALLALTSTALHTVPEEGTMIVTAGAGGFYPRGIPIGTVIGAEREAGSWQRIYLVRPLVSPSEMSHVLVLGERQPQATDHDLAAAWGIRLDRAASADTAVLAEMEAQAAAVTQPTPGAGGTDTATAREEPAAAPRRAPRRSGPRLLGEPVRRPDGQDL